jgi:hypothetical protein
MIYYQFSIEGETQSMAKLKKYRSYDRAIKVLESYVKQGVKGCMVTLSNGGDYGYGFVSSKEF